MAFAPYRLTMQIKGTINEALKSSLDTTDDIPLNAFAELGFSFVV